MGMVTPVETMDRVVGTFAGENVRTFAGENFHGVLLTHFPGPLTQYFEDKTVAERSNTVSSRKFSPVKVSSYTVNTAVGILKFLFDLRSVRIAQRINVFKVPFSFSTCVSYPSVCA